ncbi:Uncharacterized protein pbN1_04440 [Aromatoleum bremense]|nr:Uncharacterized protein pbN1_04440 [Aromatoleum bremense]
MCGARAGRASDLVFAVDSIPAIFAVTTDSFIGSSVVVSLLATRRTSS